MTRATTWMNLGDVMPGDINQEDTQNDQYCMIPLVGGTGVIKCVETKWNGGCQGLGEGEGRFFNGDSV